jgi:branched-chain amino acid transport system permease protein
MMPALGRAHVVSSDRWSAWTVALAATCLVVFLAAPFLVYPLFLTKMLCFCLFACAFNLLASTTGLLSFGHAAFFGSAAYTAGYAAKNWGVPFEAAVGIGTATGLALGAVMGFISVRRQGLYFAMITLALAQLVYFLAFQLPFTHADDGLPGIPRGHFLGLIDLNNDFAMYYTTFLIFLIGYVLIYRVVASPFGRILRAIRDNQPRAVSLGYDVDKYKIVVFALSAALSGTAGALKAIALHLATTYDLHWAMSSDVLVMAILGGSETLFGPVIGAVLITTMNDYLAETGLPVPAVVGTIFVFCILLFRQGIAGELMRLLKPAMSLKRAAPPALP